MRLLEIILTLAVLTGAQARRRGKDPYKEEMLKTNRPGKEITAVSSVCDDCKSVIEKVNVVIDDPTKMEELKYLLNMLCDSLPSSYKDECKTVVGELDTILEELKPMLRDPQTFCQEVHLCGTGRRAHAIRVVLLFVKKYVYQAADPLRANDVLCDECEFAVNELKTLLQDKSLQSEVEQDLKSYICANLGSIKDECDSLVDQYIPMVFEQLEEALNDPKGVCSQLGLCHSRRMSIPGFRLTSPLDRGTGETRLQRFRYMLDRLHTRDGMHVGCVFCKLGVTTLIDAIKNDPTIIGGMVDGLNRVCGMLPQLMIRPGCEDFLRMYARPVISLTLNELSSQKICQDLHVCSAHELREIARRGSDADWREEIVCDACKTLAGFMKYECRQLSFQEAVANEVKHVCDAAGHWAQQCDNLVDQYVPYGLQILGQELDPSTFCPAVRLCGGSRPEAPDT